MKHTISQIAVNLLLLMIGSVLCAVTVHGILVPHNFLNGGVVGVSLIVHYLTPSFGLSLIYIILNIPLFIIGWFHVSRRFILYTGFGIVFFSLMMKAFDFVKPFPVEDPILAAVLAGIIYGLGVGIVFRTAGSLGGTDILSVWLYKRFDLRLGMTSFMINAIILCAGAVLFNLEMALFTMIFVFTQGRLTDAVITGFNRRKSVMIISDESDKIAEAILKNLGRGATFLEGVGAYTGRSKRIVFCAIPLTELARLKDRVFAIDPDAFVIVQETLDVLGKGAGSRKVY